MRLSTARVHTCPELQSLVCFQFGTTCPSCFYHLRCRQTVQVFSSKSWRSSCSTSSPLKRPKRHDNNPTTRPGTSSCPSLMPERCAAHDHPGNRQEGHTGDPRMCQLKRVKNLHKSSASDGSSMRCMMLTWKQSSVLSQHHK